MLGEIADLLEIRADNPFKIRAYRNAAETVVAEPARVADMAEAALRGLPGIGKDLAQRIREIAETGDTPYRQELLAAFRDPKARGALILPPLLQLFLFAYAATLEVSNVPIGVINDDWGAASVRLISRFEQASAFSEIRRYPGLKEAQAAIDSQDVMAVVRIGQDFSRTLASGENPAVQLLLDGRTASAVFRRSPREGEDPEVLVIDPPVTLADGRHEHPRSAPQPAAL